MIFEKNACKKDVDAVRGYMTQGVPLIVWDTETTGVNPNTDRILSLSAIKIAKVNGRYREVDRINQFINPERPIPPEVTQINHITNEMVKGQPTEAQAADIIHDFFRDYPLLCGYNSVSFDEKFLSAMYQRVYGKPFTKLYHIDTFDMVMEQMPRPWRLGAVAKALGADQGLTFHNSIDDVIATYRVFCAMCRRYVGADVIAQKIETHPIRAKYWKKSDSLERLYIDMQPSLFAGVFYDFSKKRWFMPKTLTGDIRQEVLSLYNCESEEELRDKLTGRR